MQNFQPIGSETPVPPYLHRSALDTTLEGFVMAEIAELTAAIDGKYLSHHHDEAHSFGLNMYAVPIVSLWTGRAA